ncbi:MAG: hypothetical protein GTO04_01455, partial [Planctomycetales bacterium]|nr:hypothetical protein [Planctomycetales bacterium]
VAEDFAENHNLAPKHLTGIEAVGEALGLTEETEEEAAHRAKLIEMIAQWYVEAGKYNVLPIDGRGAQRVADERPAIAVARTSYTYYPGTQPVSAYAGA